jgi:hypothetical protein
MAKKKKEPEMQDLTVDPKSTFNLQSEVRKYGERQYKQMLIRDEYNKRFSMLHNGWKTTTFWLVGGLGLALLMMWFVNTLQGKPPIPI